MPAFLLGLYLVTTPAHADDIPGEFTAIRPIGMGDAFTAVANDENSVWTNPAGIGRSRKARSRSRFNVTKVPNLIAGANSNSREFYQAYKGSQDKSVASILEKSNDIAGKPLWARAAAFPVALFDVGPQSPMAAGLYSNTTVQAFIPSATPTSAQVSAISDFGAVVGYGWTTVDNRINFGLQFRPVIRYAFEDTIPSKDLLSKTAMGSHLKNDANKLQGFGIDVGALYTFADFWFPTLGVSVLNLPTGCHKNYLNPYTETRSTVCGNLFNGSINNQDALSLVDPTDFRIGLAITPRLTHTINMRLSLDAHHIPLGTDSASYGLQGIPASKLLHAGAEFYIGNPLVLPPFSVRVGYSQGFVTSGFSLSLGIVSFEFATYGADISDSSHPVEDRRYLASLSLDL